MSRTPGCRPIITYLYSSEPLPPLWYHLSDDEGPDLPRHYDYLPCKRPSTAWRNIQAIPGHIQGGALWIIVPDCRSKGVDGDGGEDGSGCGIHSWLGRRCSGCYAGSYLWKIKAWIRMVGRRSCMQRGPNVDWAVGLWTPTGHESSSYSSLTLAVLVSMPPSYLQCGYDGIRDEVEGRCPLRTTYCYWVYTASSNQTLTDQYIHWQGI